MGGSVTVSSVAAVPATDSAAALISAVSMLSGVAAVPASGVVASMTGAVRRGTAFQNSTRTRPIAASTVTARKTTSIESANPALSGWTRVSGSFCRAEVSDMMSLTALESPCTSLAAKSCAAGPSWPAAARCTAAVYSGSAAASVIRVLILCGIWEKSTERKTATPSVPPICRKNVAAAVETPMSRGGRMFCSARVSGCIRLPRPKPITAAPAMT
ncbi:hypothetical protein TSOC111612_23355 [Tsukamurella ocularis]